MKIENLVRKNILALKPYTCARDMYSEGILLDANENSIGSTIENYEDLNLNRYPDPHQMDLRQAVGNYFGVNTGNLFFGVGSDEIIDLLIRIFCDPGKDAIMILDPTYGMYKVSADINDVETISVNLNNDFQIDFRAVQANYRDNVKIIFACSPNNPTGNLLNREDVLRLCTERNSIVVIDEAYIDFSGDNSLIKYVNNYPNLVILRTFSKAWGLAGIRLGFSIADEKIIELLFKVKAPYNINSLTRSVVLKAVDNFGKKDALVRHLISERERLKDELSKIQGVKKVFESDANYLLFRCEKAKDVQKAMAEDGIIIRDRSSYKMFEDCLRVSVGTADENDKFLKALKKQLTPETGPGIISEPDRGIDKKTSGSEKSSLQENLSSRSSSKERNTKETKIKVSVFLDGQGKSNIKTGIGFFDHMLEQIAKHANLNLNLVVEGDLFVDEHHTVEDTGITLGMALSDALGEKRGIKRYGFFLPMDESIARCAIDLGGRSLLNFRCKFNREKVGDFPTELTEEFFRGLASGLKANIYLRAKGKNDHHKIEALFKAFAKSLNEACRIDERNQNILPSTKGVL